MPKQAAKNQNQTVRIFRADPTDPTNPRQERQVKESDWTVGSQKFKDEGWYREDQPPTAGDIDPASMLTILRRPEDASLPLEQKQITHGEWVGSHDAYASEGWYREDEQHSSSKPTDTMTSEARNTRTE